MFRIITRIAVVCIFGSFVASQCAAAVPTTEAQLRTAIEAASKNLIDLSATLTVKEKNKEAIVKVDEGYARMYEFQTANIQIKIPDKIRIESKLGMVKMEYIIAGGKKIFRAPKIKMNRSDDYSHAPAKLQRPLDFGIVTPLMWDSRKVEVVDDADALANNEIKVKLTWLVGDRINYAWIDADHFWLKRFEKRDGEDNLISRVEFSKPQKIDDVIWMPTVIELFAPDGDKAGETEYTDIKVNSGLPDSIFK